MAIPQGTKLGSFEVLSLIGAGGMGEVYSAHDTKLGRKVALKLLFETVARDPEKMARLEREAQMQASLNHPHVATLHGLEESEGRRFLVMELVPGETLAARISRGWLGLEESLVIMRQIAEALEAAHEKGIVHRDLKPANVKISTEGRVKLLDFGLAKALEEQRPLDMSQSPTLARGGSGGGIVLGTTWYMSPEQARGRALDQRADIWSFGCVFYEVLTGRKAFAGETVSDIIASILVRDPDWARLPSETPVKIRDLLRRCLQKDQRLRLRDIGDARIEIEETLAAPAADTGPPSSRKTATLFGAALGAALLGALLVWTVMRRTPEPPMVSRFSLALPAEEALTHLNDPVVAWSPDGTRLVYVAGNPTRLYVRRIDQIGALPVPGTEEAITAFLSPDGQWAGFYGRGKLEKVHLGGGSPIPLCEVKNGWGASWGEGDTILFSPTMTSGLFRIPASGGAPSAVTTPDPAQGELSHRWPEFLPGGRAALFTIWTGSASDARLALLSLETGRHRVLMEGVSFARYSPTGHIVFARDGQLEAAPFSPRRLEIEGPAVPLALALMTQSAVGAAHFALSGNGSLAYVPGGGPPGRTLLWVDRDGTRRPLSAARRAYEHPRLSPDGARIAVTIAEDTPHIWTYDPARDALSRQSGHEGYQPLWTPDGKRITYRSGPFDVVWHAADGSGTAEKLFSLQGAGESSSWSPDGKWLTFTDVDPKTSADVWVLSLDGERKARPLVQTAAAEAGGAFSPDGRFIAYDSNASGRLEVYVRPFPGPGATWQISTDGGRQAVWARNGREIFFRSGDRMMAVEVATEPAFAVSKPRALFEGSYTGSIEWFGYANYDVSPDGQSFLMIQNEDESVPQQLHVVLNWAEELKAKVAPSPR